MSSSLLDEDDVLAFFDEVASQGITKPKNASKRRPTERPAPPPPSAQLAADIMAFGAQDDSRQRKRLKKKKDSTKEKPSSDSRGKKRHREEEEKEEEDKDPEKEVGTADPSSLPPAKKKKKRVLAFAEDLVNAPPVRPSLSLSDKPAEDALRDALFHSGDLGSQEMAAALGLKTLGKEQDEDKMQIDGEEEEEKDRDAVVTKKKPEAPRVISTQPGIHAGWPVIFGDVEELYVRATFATSGDNFAPFVWTTTPVTTGHARGAATLRPLPSTAWGIFVVHETANAETDSSFGVASTAPTFESLADDLLADDDTPSPAESTATAAAQAEAGRDTDVDDLIEELDGVTRPSKVSTVVDPRKGAAAQPWFVIVVPTLANADLLKTISSPFFYTRVRLVAIDARQASFRMQPRARVYMLYQVLEKHAFWPVTLQYSWTIKQALSLLVDTLYIHVETKSSAAGGSKSLVEILSEILAGAVTFPLHSSPLYKLLPPSSVPVNDASDRRGRLALLRERLQKLVRENDIGVSVIHGVPVVEALALKGSRLWRQPFLFSHLEKPLSTWLLLERGIPATALASLTQWDVDSAKTVGERSALLRPLFAPRLCDVKVSELLALARHFRLEPAWFADWFETLDTFESAASSSSSLAKKKKEDAEEDANMVTVEQEEHETVETIKKMSEDKIHERRLDSYAVFCASALWHHYFDVKQRYGANYTYLFTSAQCQQWFDQGWLTRSATGAERDKLTNALVTSSSLGSSEASPLPIEDKTTIKEKALVALTKIADQKSEAAGSAATGRKPVAAPGASHSMPAMRSATLPRLVTIGHGSSALVETSVTKRVANLTQLIFETCLRWKRLKDTPAGLVAPFDELPPILVQSLYLYGPGTAQDAEANPYEAFYNALIRATAKLPAMTPLGSSTSSAQQRKPQEQQGTKRVAFVIRAQANVSQILADMRTHMAHLYLVIFDRFHLWPEHLIDAVLGEMTRRDRVTMVTHLVVTLHDHTLLDLGAAGMLQGDLMEFAMTIQRRLGCSSNGKSGGGGGPLMPPAFLRHQRSASSGLISQEAYPFEQREAQFKENVLGTLRIGTRVGQAHPPPLLQQHKTFQALINTMFMAASTTHGSPLLVLYALVRTEVEIQRRLDDMDSNWRTAGGASHGSAASTTPLATFASYEALSRSPSRVSGTFTCVLLCDLEYTGAGRATFHHINAALERCVGSLQVYKAVAAPASSTGTGVAKTTSLAPAPHVPRDEAERLISDLFFASDTKSDRLETQGQRLPLLKERLDEMLYNPKMAGRL